MEEKHLSEHPQKPKLTVPQMVLLGVLYGLVILMIVFSLLAAKNSGQQGYDKCMKEKCAERGDALCSKPREINNCCLGAGGEMAASGNGYVCVFG